MIIYKILVREEYGYRHWVWKPTSAVKDFAHLQALFYERVKGDATLMDPRLIDPTGTWIRVWWNGKHWVDGEGKPHHPTKHVECHVHTQDDSYLELERK